MTDDAKSPRYRAIEIDLRRKIGEGELTAGQMLPGRRDLARQYSVSTLTIERAIDGLVREGLLRSDDRRGTFVATAAPPHPLQLPSSRQLVLGVIARLFPPHQDRGFGNNAWVREIVQAAEQELSSDRHSTVFINTVLPDGSARSLTSAIQEAQAHAAEGLLIVALDSSPEEVGAAQSFLEDRQIPSVFVTSAELPRPGVHTFPDGFDAGYQAAQHLIRQGCSELCYITPFAAWWADQRWRGLAAAWSAAELPAKNLRRYPESGAIEWSLHPNTIEEGERIARLALRNMGSRAGLVGASDEIALGILRALKSADKKAGVDCLVLGFDDIPQMREVHATSLRPPWEALGTEGAVLLRNALLDVNSSTQVRLRWKLIPRASTRWSSPG